MTTTESNKDQPLSTTSADQDRAIKDQPLRQQVSGSLDVKCTVFVGLKV